ncbi:PorV/PorQ family protein [uncultured Dokdonia sp.]|uniref:putative type IX sorting system protein PorV2 n=1 Tax=uncultured Dokdonia sp. TaxID=575653 RepID=UPI002630129C|nr:PorV/PorQ family protein [uncultured Dokdonia sp.]
MKKNITIIFILLTISVSAQAVRKYSNEFLNIGVDAAALGMSNAVVASTNDVNSGYWNPAGLVHLEDNQISIMHAAYFANIANYDYVAFAKPLDDKSAIGLSVIRFGVDDILNTTQLIDAEGNIDFNRISLFSTADWAVTFSYARELPLDGLNIGANAKVVRRVIGDFASSWGFGIDIGLQWQKGNWNFGLMARDITTTVNAWSIDEEQFATISDAVEGQNQELPESTEITIPKLQAGFGRTWIHHYDYSFKAEIDLNVRFAQTNDIVSSSAVSVTPAFGFEFGYSELVYVRAGVGNFQEITALDNSTSIGFQPNIGVGFKYKGIHVDYALTDIGDQSAAIYSNVFSLKLDWELFR